MVVNINFDTIPEAVQTFLEQEAISESEFADRAGIPQPVLNRLARGEVTYPSLLTFKRLWPFIGEYLITASGKKTLPA